MSPILTVVLVLVAAAVAGALGFYLGGENRKRTPEAKKASITLTDASKAIADYITVHDETVDDTKGLTIFDPMATWKRKDVYNFEARELLVPIFKNGKRVYDCPPLEEIKAYCAQQVDTLWDEVKRFDYPHKYYVDLSDKLWDIQQCLLRTSQM